LSRRRSLGGLSPPGRRTNRRGTARRWASSIERALDRPARRDVTVERIMADDGSAYRSRDFGARARRGRRRAPAHQTVHPVATQSRASYPNQLAQVGLRPAFKQPCVVNVHPGDPPVMAASVATHSLAGLLRMNRVHRDGFSVERRVAATALDDQPKRPAEWRWIRAIWLTGITHGQRRLAK
jgi:hypothetical protein